MCGIAGASVSSTDNTRRVLDSLFHRGPDRLSYYEDDDLTLLHSLLSTRGQAADADQPVHTTCERWVFVYNGEIYNTKYLLKILNRKNLKDKSDTLLLSLIIQKFGLKFVEHIDGMFAIGLFDKKNKKLYLYRDQSGQKNIYFRFKNGDLFFASELQALLQFAPNASNHANGAALRLSAHLGYWSGRKTLISGVDRLLPGQILEYSLRTKSFKFYFFYGRQKEFSEQKENCFENLISNVFDANCKVALNLSGGMDSSIILHELSKSYSSINTYTTLYSDCENDANSEAILARKLAENYGSNHTEYEISQRKYIDGFEDAYRSLDEPNYNVSIPIYHQLAKYQGLYGQKERVLFSGDGGDEVFCGYPHYKKSQTIDNYSKYLTSKLFSKLFALKSKGRKSIDFNDPIERWLFFKFWENSFLMDPVSREEMARELKSEFNHVYQEFKKNKSTSHSTMQLDRQFWLAGENFTRVDKIYMGQSIEVRLPFATPEFVSLLDYKIRKSGSLTKHFGKALIRQRYKNKLPDYITNRMAKVGWRGPMDQWFSTKMKELFLDITPTKNSEIVRWEAVRKHISEADKWPGKQIHWYLSSAILSKKFNLEI